MYLRLVDVQGWAYDDSAVAPSNPSGFIFASIRRVHYCLILLAELPRILDLNERGLDIDVVSKP